MKHYDLLSSLGQADSCINIGHYLRGDAKEAETVTRRSFRGCAGKRFLAAIERFSHSERAGKDRKVMKHPEQLKLVEVSVFGRFVRSLFDYGDVPNVMLADICNRVELQRYSTTRRMRTADGTET